MKWQRVVVQDLPKQSTTIVQQRSSHSRAVVGACGLAALIAASLAGSTRLRAEGATRSDPVQASDASTTATRDTLFKQMLKHPTDAGLAMSYVQVCIGLHDYEGAIGTLERVLYYTPDDKSLQAQLGLLYAQLHSYQTASQYIEGASGPGLDATSRDRITTAAPAIHDGAAGSHVFGTLQAGFRSQTNAAFNPDNDILRVANQDYLLTHRHGSDGNAFQLAQIGYDHDLGNQRGDTIEARLAGYATQQFRFSDLNVGLYDITIGPRLAISPGNLPGWSVKPYAAGGQVFLAGQR